MKYILLNLKTKETKTIQSIEENKLKLFENIKIGTDEYEVIDIKKLNPGLGFSQVGVIFFLNVATK